MLHERAGSGDVGICVNGSCLDGSRTFSLRESVGRFAPFNSLCLNSRSFLILCGWPLLLIKCYYYFLNFIAYGTWTGSCADITALPCFALYLFIVLPSYHSTNRTSWMVSSLVSCFVARGKRYALLLGRGSPCVRVIHSRCVSREDALPLHFLGHTCLEKKFPRLT